jgi:DUF4097 and DUF4098 domain-containing protein YvlB
VAKKSLHALTLFLFVVFCGSGPAAAEEINKNFHQSFNVKAGDSLCLRFGDGNVTVVPWEKDVIDVSVRYRADIDVAGIRLGGRNDFDVEFRQTGNTVYVTAKEPSSGAIGFYNKKVYEYVYEIHSPGTVHLDLEGDDGDVKIENWAAEVECRVDDGDIHLKNITGGRTDLRTDDGDVTIDQLSGDLTITMDDGDVTLTACDLGSCRVDGEDGEVRVRQSKGSFDITVDDGNVIMERIEARGLHISAAEGDIDVDLLTGPTPLDAELKTEDGDIEIDLEKGFSVSFHISADDPDNVRLDMTGIESFKEDRYGKSGSINGGTGRMRIRTDEGDVTIKEKS